MISLYVEYSDGDMMKKNGFTLIELLAVIVIIAIIGGVGVVSYQNFFGTSEEKYYSVLESDILLAGNDYYLDHRDQLPVENYFSAVSLNELIESKYLEPVKDSSGNICTKGTVYAYKENSKYNYEVCLECGGYKSNGTYCNGAVSKKITVVAQTKDSKVNYNAQASYNNATYTNNENVIVTFSMQGFNVSRYEAESTKANIKRSCNVRSNNSCSVEIDESSTYKVVAYDENNEEIATTHINVKIARNGPQYIITGENKYVIDKNACSKNQTKKRITFTLVKDNVNEEYKTIKYRITNNGTKVTSGYRSINNLIITEDFESGNYTLEVVIANFADEETVKKHTFDVSYYIDAIYDDDNTKFTHEVVKDFPFDYFSALPKRKKAYGVNNLDIRWLENNEGGITDKEERWAADNKRITGSSIVTKNCTHTIVGMMKIPVQVETFTNYCNDLVYTAQNQTLTKNAPANVSFLDTTKKVAGDHTVKAHIDKSKYIWKDETFADKPFICNIKKATPLVTISATNGIIATTKTRSFTATVRTATTESTVGTLVMSSNNTSIATVSPASKTITATTTGASSGDITVTGKSKGASSISVVFKPNDTANYNNSAPVVYTANVRTKVEVPVCRSNLIYTGGNQDLVQSGTGYTLSNNVRKIVGKQDVRANISDVNTYAWPDNSQSEKTIKDCSIAKYTPSINLSATSGSVNALSNNTFTASPVTISACQGTLTSASENTDTVTITDGASYSNVANGTAKTIKYYGVSYTTGTNIKVNYKPSDTANCNNADEKKFSAKVNRITQTITLAEITKTYNGATQAASGATTSGNGRISYEYYTNSSCTTKTGTSAGAGGAASSGGAPKTAGTWYVKVIAAQTGQYNEATKCVKYTINKKDLTIIASKQTVTYGTDITKNVNQVTSSGLVNGHSVSSITLTPSTKYVTTTGTITPSAAVIKVGSEDVTSNYSISYTKGTLVINKKALTITASNQTVTYGTAITQGVSKISASGLVYSDSVSEITLTQSTKYVTSGGTITPSGGKVKAGSTDVTGNYSITYKNGTLKIDKKALTITASNQTVTYGTAITQGVGKMSASGLVYSDSVSSISLTQNATNVPGGTITPSKAKVVAGSTDVTGNYSITYKNGNVTINTKAITPSANCQNKTYDGGKTASCSISFSGVLSGDSVSGSGDCTFSNASAGSNKTVTCSVSKSGTSSGNYHLSKTSATDTATINRAKTATTGSCNSLTFNGSNQTLASGGSYVSYSNNSGKNAGSYTVTVTADSNHLYSDGKETKTLSCSIGPKTLTVTADNKSKYYTENNPSLTYSYTGNVSGSTPTFSGSLTTSAGKNSSIGTYSITRGSLSLTNGNYSMSFNNGTLTIKDPCTSTWTSCGNYGTCSSTYTFESAGTKYRSCTDYSNYVSGYVCRSSYSDSATCYGTKDACASTTTSCGDYGTCSSTYTFESAGTKKRTCQNYSREVPSHKCGSSYSDSATCYGTIDACASTTTSCGNYGNCDVTYKQETGSQSRTCQKYSSAVPSHKCGSSYSETSSCNGSTDACIYKQDYPSCGDYGTCSVKYTDETGTKTRSCQHHYAAPIVINNSWVECGWGSSYTDSAACTGSDTRPSTTCNWVVAGQSQGGSCSDSDKPNYYTCTESNHGGGSYCCKSNGNCQWHNSWVNYTCKEECS